MNGPLAAFAGAIALAAGFATDAEAGGMGPTDGQLAACNHYENRARFRPRHGEADFVTTLAEACRSALTAMDGTDPRQRAAAERLLAGVVELHRIIVSMTVERKLATHVAGTDAAFGPSGSLVTLPRVTDTGEFLIAHRIGVVNALDGWTEIRNPPAPGRLQAAY